MPVWIARRQCKIHLCGVSSNVCAWKKRKKNLAKVLGTSCDFCWDTSAEVSDPAGPLRGDIPRASKIRYRLLSKGNCVSSLALSRMPLQGPPSSKSRRVCQGKAKKGPHAESQEYTCGKLPLEGHCQVTGDPLSSLAPLLLRERPRSSRHEAPAGLTSSRFGVPVVFLHPLATHAEREASVSKLPHFDAAAAPSTPRALFSRPPLWLAAGTCSPPRPQNVVWTPLPDGASPSPVRWEVETNFPGHSPGSTTSHLLGSGAGACCARASAKAGPPGRIKRRSRSK